MWIGTVTMENYCRIAALNGWLCRWRCCCHCWTKILFPIKFVFQFLTFIFFFWKWLNEKSSEFLSLSLEKQLSYSDAMNCRTQRFSYRNWRWMTGLVFLADLSSIHIQTNQWNKARTQTTDRIQSAHKDTIVAKQCYFRAKWTES